MENRYKIVYDLKQRLISNIRFMQGDKDSSVIEVTLVDGGMPVNIMGEWIEFRFLKPDKTVVYQDGTTGVSPIDTTNGKVECVLMSNTLAAPGLVKCEIHRKGMHGEELTTPAFSFTVGAGIGDSGVLSSNYITEIDRIKNDYLLATHENTEVEIVQARGGKDNINARLVTIEQTAASYKAESATKTELLLKRDKTIKITSTDVSDELMLMFSPAGTVSPVIADKSVTPSKTSFMQIGKNLFDKNTATLGYYVNNVSGVVSVNASYNVSDYIEVLPNTQYFRSYDHQLAFYDVDKIFISGVTGYGGNANNVVTTPANCKYARMNVNTDSLNTLQFELGAVKTTYEPFKIIVSTSALPIIPKELIAKNSIEIDNLNYLVIGKNLFNKATRTIGYYVNAVISGILSVSASYDASDYIEVLPNTQYFRNYGHQMAFYDINKTFISGDISNLTFTTPINCYYIRVSVTPTETDIFQLELGIAETSYEPYGLYLPNSLLQNDITMQSKKDDFLLFLPSEICIAVGRTIELYNSQISWCGNIDNYHFKYVCSVGNNKNRKWTCTGTLATVGNYPMALIVYDNDFVEITRATTTIKIVNKETDIVIPKKMLCIGDSLSNDKPWYAEWDSLSNAMFSKKVIEFVGTNGTTEYKHEGQSGATSLNYITNSALPFQGNTRITVSGVVTPPALKKVYTIITTGYNVQFEVESFDLVGGAGTIDLNRLVYPLNVGNVYPTGTIVGVNDGIVGDKNITYTSQICTSYNPFWNPNTSAVDMNYYTTQSTVNPDAVQIFLGTNSIDIDPAANVANIKLLVDSIQRDWAGKPIYIVFTTYKSSQDGLGGSSLKMEEDRKVYNLMSALYNALKTYTNLYFIPVALIVDMEYCWGRVDTPINSRLSETYKTPVEGTHPQLEGYLQMADTMFSTWLAHY